MFNYNSTGTESTMHAGDTGAFKVHATRATGADWTDANTGETYAGGRSVEADAPLDVIPLFTRNGRKLI